MAARRITNMQDAEALLSKGTVLLDFFKKDCGPCKLLAPTIDSLAAEYAGRATVVKVDVDDLPILALRYGVESFPTVFILKNGDITNFFTGRKPAPIIRKMIEETL